MNDILFAAVLAASSVHAAAPKAVKAAPAASPLERLADMYVEARVAHFLVGERAKRVIGLKPFDSLDRHHADYEHAVGFLESRSVAQPSLQKAALALPKTLPSGGWGRHFLVLAQEELQNAEKMREAGRSYPPKEKTFGPEVAGLTSWAKLEARTIALFGEDPYGPALKRVDALAGGPLAKDPTLPRSDPGFALYVRAQARILRRLAAAFTADTDRMVAERTTISRAELKRILGPCMMAFADLSNRLIYRFEPDLKDLPAFEGADAVNAAAALKDLEAAAADAERARAAFEAVKARVEQFDAETAANYKPDPDDDYGPDTLMPAFNSWARDLDKVVKGNRASAAVLASKLPAKP